MSDILNTRQTTRAMLLATVMALAAMPAQAVEVADDPFARPGLAAPLAAPQVSPLESLELTGISTIGGPTWVCLADRATQRTRWLAVGETTDGIAALEYDRQRDVVRVQSGSASRWISLRKATIVTMDLPRMDHGAIDWAHLRLNDREKARKAEDMVTEIMESSQRGRAAGKEVPR